MPDYPRPCPKCGVLTEEAGFGVDRSKASGRRAHCRECECRRKKAHYAAHRDELRAARLAAKEAALQAELRGLETVQRKRVAAARKAHAAGVRRQKALLRELGVPDVSAEEVTERARRDLRCWHDGGEAEPPGRAETAEMTHA
jgi:hypothetical protein